MIGEYIESHGLKFKINSETGRKWQERVAKYKVEAEFTKSAVDFTEDMLNELWDSLNFSFKEFVGIIVEGLSPK